MRPVVCIIDTGSGPIVIITDVRSSMSLETFRQHDIPNTRKASDYRLLVSGTINLHIQMCELRTREIFSVVEISWLYPCY